MYPPGSSGRTSGLLFAVLQRASPAAQWIAIPTKSLVAWLELLAASIASGEPGPNTVVMSAPVFSSSRLAMETAPTLHPARVNGTHGAGAFLPSCVSILKVGSETGLTKSVQYVNDVVNVEPSGDAGLK